ncbi:MAG: DUF5703 domain-containing protein [Verrucomicrobia bacterium]|nr:DUF5703 domain-containing protein [Verrucomicrobiota bacterium]
MKIVIMGFMSAVLATSWVRAAEVSNEVQSADTQAQPDLAWLSQSNVTWNSPSKDSLGSMPLGNGDIGLNVWVEEGGDLQFYISKADAFDGNHVNRKLGKIRIALKPNPFASGLPFRQTLDLQNARIAVQAGQPGEAVSLEVWVDANHPSIHVRGRSDLPLEAQVSVESGRPQRQVASLAAAHAQPDPPDVLLADKADRLLWCFRNESSIWSAQLTKEGSGELAKTMTDPLLHRTFGALARGPGLVRQSPTALAAAAKTKLLDLSIHILNNQTDTTEQWQAQLDQQAAVTDKLDPTDTWQAHCQWWSEFWHRSRIVVAGCEPAKTLTQGHALERFMQACASRGAFPLLFNGSIFTMDMPAGTYAFGGPRGTAVNADHRDWEGLPIMWQNTRLPYWSMIARGDFDLMRPVFQAVFDALEVSKSRSQAWYQHDGAMMTEAMLWKGVSALLPVPQHLQYHFTSNVEMPSMMCDYYAYTQDRQFLRDVLLPCADAFVTFFEKHFIQRDAQGKMVVSPAGAVETYQPVTNPVTEVCGLRYLLGQLAAMDVELIGKGRKEHWRKLLDELPAVPTRVIKGQTLLAPGETYSGRLICETPELYAIYPFRQVTLWNPDLLAVGRQSFAVRQLSLDGTPDTQSWQTGGWVQAPMQAAYLGLPKAAAKLVGLNFADEFPWFGNNRYGDHGNTLPPQPGHPHARFPAFWETKMDYTPDNDHGANSANGLQSMILQTNDRQIYVLPAWPEDWAVEFKLHAPYQTTVEGAYRDGKLQSLKVTPASRAADVIDMTTQANRIRTLVSVACADRNKLFGLSPMADGQVMPEDVARLKTTGPWLAKYGESLYGVCGGPFAAGRWGGSVSKGKVVYLHVLDWPGEQLHLPPLPKKIVAATVLTGGQVSVKQDGQDLLISLPAAQRDQIDTIIKLELEGPI